MLRTIFLIIELGGITKHLMTGAAVNCEFCFPSTSMFPSGPVSKCLYFSSILIYMGWEGIQPLESFYQRDISLITLMQLWLYKNVFMTKHRSNVNSEKHIKKGNNSCAERNPFPLNFSEFQTMWAEGSHFVLTYVSGALIT